MQKVCVFESMLQQNKSGFNYSNIITSFHKSVSVLDRFKTNTHGLIKTNFIGTSKAEVIYMTSY